MSELYDFIHKDVAKWYPDLTDHIKLTLVEAGPGILGSFDKALSEVSIPFISLSRTHPDFL